MMKCEGFEIVFSSDSAYEYLCAEIYFNGKFFALLSQEDGLEYAKVEVASGPTVKWEFDYDDFHHYLKEAYRGLSATAVQ